MSNEYLKYVSRGYSVDIAVAKKVANGDIYTAGGLSGITLYDAANGENVTLAVSGVFNVKKVSGALAVGDFVKADGTDSTSAAKSTAATDIRLGIVVEPAATPDTHVKVLLR